MSEADAIRSLASKVMGWEDTGGLSLQMIRVVLCSKAQQGNHDAVRCIRAIDHGLDPSNPKPLWLGRPLAPQTPSNILE